MMDMETYNCIVQTEKVNPNTDSLAYIYLQAPFQLGALQFKLLSMKRDTFQSSPH